MKARKILSKKGRGAVSREILLQLLEYDKKNEIEIDAMLLYVLHTQFGFGKKRLRKVYEAVGESFNDLEKRYELNETDNPWLCTYLLKADGIDILEWENNKK